MTNKGKDLDIATINSQIERLKPIWEKIKKEIEADIKDPASAEFVVRHNEREEYFLLILTELMDMYDAYMDATDQIMSKKPSKEKVEQPIENQENQIKDVEEDIDDEEEGLGTIRSGKSLEIKGIPKRTKKV